LTHLFAHPPKQQIISLQILITSIRPSTHSQILSTLNLELSTPIKTIPHIFVAQQKYMQQLGINVCKKQDLGVHNNLFGGTMLSWIDESAVAFVNEICYTPSMVTLKMDEVLFKEPVKENNLIKIYGEIMSFGNTTVKIRVEARKFNVYTHEEKLVCSTNIVFVRIDDDGRAIPIAQHVKDRYPDLQRPQQ
jgi:acyl-CoA thioesterase YciA